MRFSPLPFFILIAQFFLPFSSSELSGEMIFVDEDEGGYVDDDTPKPAPKSHSPPAATPAKKNTSTVTYTQEKQSQHKSKDDPEGDEKECHIPSMGMLDIRHIEGKGVGYSDGYTTLETFLVFPFPHSSDSYVPFVDLRGHIFDDGKFASNIGLGTRLLRSHIHTMGVYYDYRDTKHYHYNQISLAYENLGRVFDWRVNGYFPFGEKYSPSYQHAQFDSFQGHYLMISRKKEFSMWGINAEIGKDITKKLRFKCYGAIGPYYYGRSDTNAWGGQARLVAEINKYIKIDVNTSYDSVFHWIGQGELSLIWTLGPAKSSKPSKKWCSKDPFLRRVSQRVDRNEIIVVDHKKHKTKAINPATGQPYYFWFVNNTSSSQGTYESPFSNLADAQSSSAAGDIIYVYPGNGTDQGMNSGIILKNNQRFLSSSLSYNFPTTKGNVTVPAATKKLPQISNSSAFLPYVVVLSNNNEVAGFSINDVNNQQAIAGGAPFGGNAANPLIHDSIITSGFGEGIFLFTNLALGNVTIYNCNISSGAEGIHIDSNVLINTISITNSIISGNSTNGIILVSNGPVGTLSITNSSISALAGNGINILSNVSFDTLNISNCSVSSTGGIGIRFRLNSDLGTTNIANCSIKNTTGLGINFDTNDASGAATISNCAISAPGASYGISFTNNPNVSPPFRLNLFENTITLPPPSIAGFNIVNPGPITNFVLDVHGNTGTLLLPNPVTLVGP